MKIHLCLKERRNRNNSRFSFCKSIASGFQLATTFQNENKNSAFEVIIVLKQCCKTRDLDIGQRIHQNASTEHHFQSNMILTNTLLSMYCKCGNMQLAREVFHGAVHKDVTTWNCLLHGHVESGENQIALQMYQIIDCQPDYVTFVTALKACTALAGDKTLEKLEVLNKGIAIHDELEMHGHSESNTLVSNCLVNMYSRCGSMYLARGVFNSMRHKDVISWTCLIQGYVENGQSSVALDLFMNMDCEPDSVTCVAAIKACAALDVEKALGVHQRVKDLSFESSVVVVSALVDMYRRLGEMTLAREVFERVSVRNVVVWTCLIQGYVEKGEFSLALHLFHSMNCEPDDVTYVAALRACTGVASKMDCDRTVALNKGLAIHEKVRRRGLVFNKIVASALISMYSKCGRMDLAKKVFDGMMNRDPVAWTCLILGYAENGSSRVALGLFDTMDCTPDRVTYIAVVKALSALASESDSERQVVLRRSTLLHKRIKDTGLDVDLSILNSLIDMYSKCRITPLARDIFERMVNKDVVTWNSIIQGYVTNGKNAEALELFDAMDCDPDNITFVAALKACAGLASEKETERQRVLEKGTAIHEEVKKRKVESNIVVANTLIDMYSRCGVIVGARELFERMVNKDVVTWTTLILGYVENGKSWTALELFETMDLEPDHVTYIAVLKACTVSACGRESERRMIIDKGFGIHQEIRDRGLLCTTSLSNALIDMYRRFGCMEVARDVFQSMRTKDVVTWTSLILGYVQNGESSLALDIFNAMDCDPDRITYVAVLSACGDSADLLFGRRVHGTICRLGLEEDVVVATALVDSYGRCGCMTRAVEVFDTMHCPDVVSWNALIAGYSSLGDSSQMFDAVMRMQEAGLRLDAVTFVSILTACSHAGMVKEGEFYFRSMREHVVSPNLSHYNCMIDMLGRANRRAEAVSLVNTMPFRSNEVTWTTLLGEGGKLAYKDNDGLEAHLGCITCHKCNVL